MPHSSLNRLRWATLGRDCQKPPLASCRIERVGHAARVARSGQAHIGGLGLDGGNRQGERESSEHGTAQAKASQLRAVRHGGKSHATRGASLCRADPGLSCRSHVRSRSPGTVWRQEPRRAYNGQPSRDTCPDERLRAGPSRNHDGWRNQCSDRVASFRS